MDTLGIEKGEQKIANSDDSSTLSVDCSLFSVYYPSDEKDLSTEEAKASADARLFEASAEHDRKESARPPPQKGSSAPLGITMKRGNRLKRADMAALSSQLRRVHGAYFSLSVSLLPRSRESAFTCIVSKQVTKKAVDRNLVKRRCREAVRPRLQNVSANRPLALVFRAKSKAKDATFSEINRDVDALFDKIMNLR